MDTLMEAVVSLLLLIGAGFTLVGAYGLAKLSDFAKRLHGPTKATTLGVGSILIASALWFSLRGDSVSFRELLITLFLFVTAPVSAHLLVKAAMQLDPSLRPPPQPDSAVQEKSHEE